MWQLENAISVNLCFHCMDDLRFSSSQKSDLNGTAPCDLCMFSCDLAPVFKLLLENTYFSLWTSLHFKNTMRWMVSFQKCKVFLVYLQKDGNCIQAQSTSKVFFAGYF